MNRRLLLGQIAALVALSACGNSGPVTRYGPDGKPLPRVYRLSRGSEPQIQYRMLDSINALRMAAGSPALQLNAQLNAAAATHSRDMSVQNRPWAFGSDGSSPLELIARAGYPGSLRAELISESYETELETLAGWMEEPEKRDAIVDPRATDMGFAFFQERNGKIWWTLITGRRIDAAPGS